MAGLVPAMTMGSARPCRLYRDGRDKSGHDEAGIRP
jgi:hypothetical protein